MIKIILTTLFIFLLSIVTKAQGEFIRTKEGRAILNRRQMINSCLQYLKKDKSDETALTICECQTDKFEGHFTNKQYKAYTTNGSIDLAGLLKEDTLFNKSIQQCYTNSGKTILLQAESSEFKFIEQCIKGYQALSKKSLDFDRLSSFCNCQLELVKSKKLSDADMETLRDINSPLSFTIMSTCGDPYSEIGLNEKNWNEQFLKDIQGPASDTIQVIPINGMTYMEVKIGSITEVWLFDTGASDLLINTDLEIQLKKESILNQDNYKGIGEYEMANGMIDTCRKYIVNHLQIGKFTVNNVAIAVTDKGKRIIVGKSLFNKFSNWILNNQQNIIVLKK